MSEELRITEPGLAKALLDSMAADGPTDAARAAAAASLGIAVRGAPTSSVGAPRVASAVRWRKLLAVTVATTVVGVIAVRYAIDRPTGERATPVAAPQSEPARPSAPAPTEVAPTTPPSIAPTATPAAHVVKRRIPRAATSDRATASESPPAETAPAETAPAETAPAEVNEASTLREETLLLDSARAALRQKAAGDALELLGRYARRFTHGMLAIEASALRVEALFQAGQRDAALALGQEFLARHGNSALANRVRSLIEKSRDQNAASHH